MTVDQGQEAGGAVPGAIPVLEIGGTHVVAALVDVPSGAVTVSQRHGLDSSGSVQAVIDTLVAAAEGLGSHPRWGVAVPGPFDYDLGIGRFQDVGKFDALAGVDLGQALSARLPGRPQLSFLNDADAFGIGEATTGAAMGHRRAVCLTLGTGIGSAFISDGEPVNDGPLVPPDGSVHLLRWQGDFIEETVSRRGLLSTYARLTGRVDLDVRDLAELARSGDPAAHQTFDECFQALGSCLAPWVARFDASALVLGGSISRSFDLVHEPLRRGLLAVEPGLTVRPQPAQHSETAALVGAAIHAARRSRAIAGPDHQRYPSGLVANHLSTS